MPWYLYTTIGLMLGVVSELVPSALLAVILSGLGVIFCAAAFIIVVTEGD